MSSSRDEIRQETGGSVPPRIANTATAMRADVARLHDAWMTWLFARGLRDDHSVVEHREPLSPSGVWAYRLWAAVGVLVLVAVYPLFVLGLATRFYSRRLDRVSASLGFVGVVVVSLVVWGALTALTYLSPIAFEGLVAVAVAGVVATVSAVLALYFTRRPGRLSTVVFGYPFGVTALFLPPVVASLYSPTLASVVFPSSESLAILLLDTILAVGGLAGFIRATFELEGLAYVLMWFLLAVPTGWVLGALVTLANGFRRTGPPVTVDEVNSGRY